MKKLGFIHDMMDVKVLILYAAARTNYPLTLQELYELCYQDDCLSYFDICTAVPELVQSGHLQALPEDRYEITEKGRHHGELTADSIVFTVKQRVENAVEKFNRQLRRKSFVTTRIDSNEAGEISVTMTLRDEMGHLMTLSLMAPDNRQALRLGKLLEQKAEDIYNLTMMELLDEEEEI
jgi:hypothetical protein